MVVPYQWDGMAGLCLWDEAGPCCARPRTRSSSGPGLLLGSHSHRLGLMTPCLGFWATVVVFFVLRFLGR